jgi:2-amino-4-hydroxy-6-hydroxymethyldihydropteridine diphosphokinase
MNRAVVGLGSNIEPEENIRKAREFLARQYTVLKESSFKKTKSIGPTKQADFLNGAVLLEVDSELGHFKSALKGLESALGRKRTPDRNAPRPIDLDILVWNGSITDKNFYQRDFLKESVLELIPDLEF